MSQPADGYERFLAEQRYDLKWRNIRAYEARTRRKDRWTVVAFFVWCLVVGLLGLAGSR